MTEARNIKNNKDLIFSEPWQAELFAITLKLHEKGLFDWESWTKKLGVSLKREKDTSRDDLEHYFLNWLLALEETLLENKVTELKVITMIEKAWKDAITKTPHGKKVEISGEVLNSI